jgi:hypothetical protein
MDSRDVLRIPGATAAHDALSSAQLSGRHVVEIEAGSSTSGLISVDALAREGRSGRQLTELADAASTVIRQEAIPLVKPSWLSEVGIIRVAADDSQPLAPICPVDHTICRCHGICINL